MILLIFSAVPRLYPLPEGTAYEDWGDIEYEEETWRAMEANRKAKEMENAAPLPDPTPSSASAASPLPSVEWFEAQCTDAGKSGDFDAWKKARFALQQPWPNRTREEAEEMNMEHYSSQDGRFQHTKTDNNIIDGHFAA